MTKTYTLMLVAASILVWIVGLGTASPYLSEGGFGKMGVPAVLALLMTLWLQRKGLFGSDVPVDERRPFNAMAALALLLSVALAYADLFLLEGEIFRGTLDFFGLGFFTGNARWNLTVACAFAVWAPILYVLAGLAFVSGFFSKTRKR